MTPRWTRQRSIRPTGRNYRAQLGLPSVDAVQMGAWRSGTPAHSDFSAILPPDGATANPVMARIAGQIESAGFDFAGCVTRFPRHALGLALVSFDKGLETDRAAVGALFPALFGDRQCRRDGTLPQPHSLDGPRGRCLFSPEQCTAPGCAGDQGRA